MNITLIILGIFVLSFILAIWSMRDLGSAYELLKIIKRGKIKGAIVFFKDKIVHLK